MQHVLCCKPMTTAQFSLINQAIDYTENRLTQPLTVAEVAAAVGYSRFHFTRLFQTTTGMTLRTYFRNRRLSEAAGELLHSAKPILDIALDYQFGSQEAFSRAFKRVFSVSPQVYRKRRRYRRRFLRITLRHHTLLQTSHRIATPIYGNGVQQFESRIVTARLHALKMPDGNDCTILRYWR